MKKRKVVGITNMSGLKFIIECPKCGAMGFINPETLPSQIGVSFRQGTLNIMDTMAMYCNKCGFKEEIGIEWPIKIYKE